MVFGSPSVLLPWIHRCSFLLLEVWIPLPLSQANLLFSSFCLSYFLFSVFLNVRSYALFGNVAATSRNSSRFQRSPFFSFLNYFSRSSTDHGQGPWVFPGQWLSSFLSPKQFPDSGCLCHFRAKKVELHAAATMVTLKPWASSCGMREVLEA